MEGWGPSTSETEVEIELPSGELVLVEVEVNLDADTLAALNVHIGPGYGTQLCAQEAEEWVTDHEAEIWKALADKDYSVAVGNAADRYTRRAESGWGE